jgi:hypothetical protein
VVVAIITVLYSPYFICQYSLSDKIRILDPDVCLVELKEMWRTTGRIIGVPIEIGTAHLTEGNLAALLLGAVRSQHSGHLIAWAAIC